MDPRPTRSHPIVRAYVDDELARECVTYVLRSGAEGAVHIDHALDYDEDPRCLADLMIHKLTVEVERRVEQSGLSRRELARRLRTSVPQLYRPAGPHEHAKDSRPADGLLPLLDCEVRLVGKSRRAA